MSFIYHFTNFEIEEKSSVKHETHKYDPTKIWIGSQRVIYVHPNILSKLYFENHDVSVKRRATHPTSLMVFEKLLLYFTPIKNNNKRTLLYSIRGYLMYIIHRNKYVHVCRTHTLITVLTNRS